MVTMKKELYKGLSEIQNKEYQVLVDLLNLFKSSQLPYFITGGTVLGANFYKDFIPYDDDIDISMPRKDYNNFIKLAQKKLPPEYKVRHYLLDSNFKYSIVRVENTSINIVEVSDPNQKISHPAIDVAPLDGVPSNLRKRKRFFLKLNILRGLLSWYYADSINMKKNRTIFQRVLIIMLRTTSKLGSKIINPVYVKQRIDGLLSKYPPEKSPLAGTYMGAYKEKEMILSSIWGKGKKYQFRSLLLNGPEKTDEYINAIYGGFKELSPNEAMKARHYVISDADNNIETTRGKYGK